MPKKALIRGNYFILQDTQTNTEYEAHQKNCFVRRRLDTSEEFFFTGLNGFSDAVAVTINQDSENILDSDLIKEDNSPFTLSEWLTFYSKNTGNFNTPQAGGDYATTEKVIGILNGDTLFRKCFFPEDTSSFVSISHGIDSINFLAKCQISCVVDAGSFGVFDINNSSVILGETSLTQTDIYIDNANLFALTNILIILEYTKQPA